MSERLDQILSEYQQAIDAAFVASADETLTALRAKRQELIEANPDLAADLLEHFDATGEPSIADTISFGKIQYDTVTHVARAEFDTVTPAPHNESQAPGQTASNALSRFGDYELIQEIARGGMGVVYKARQRNADRIVALKMILSGQLAGEDEVSRFHSEAKAAANLDHPGIVPVHDVGEIDGQHYFSMGYVEGGSLSEKLKDGPLPPRVAVEYMKSIAEAVAFAHAKGVIHRDLKPGNILVGSDGRPRVTDFWFGKAVGRR